MTPPRGHTHVTYTWASHVTLRPPQAEVAWSLSSSWLERIPFLNGASRPFMVELSLMLVGPVTYIIHVAYVTHVVELSLVLVGPRSSPKW